MDISFVIASFTASAIAYSVALLLGPWANFLQKERAI
jgi:hypothetical protein